MSTTPPKRHERLSADVEKWQLEMAQELGIIDEVRAGRAPSGGRFLLRPHHYHPQDRAQDRKPTK